MQRFSPPFLSKPRRRGRRASSSSSFPKPISSCCRFRFKLQSEAGASCYLARGLAVLSLPLAGSVALFLRARLLPPTSGSALRVSDPRVSGLSPERRRERERERGAYTPVLVPGIRIAMPREACTSLVDILPSVLLATLRRTADPRTPEETLAQLLQSRDNAARVTWSHKSNHTASPRRLNNSDHSLIFLGQKQCANYGEEGRWNDITARFLSSMGFSPRVWDTINQRSSSGLIGPGSRTMNDHDQGNPTRRRTSFGPSVLKAQTKARSLR